MLPLRCSASPFHGTVLQLSPQYPLDSFFFSDVLMIRLLCYSLSETLFWGQHYLLFFLEAAGSQDFIAWWSKVFSSFLWCPFTDHMVTAKDPSSPFGLQGSTWPSGSWLLPKLFSPLAPCHSPPAILASLQIPEHINVHLGTFAPALPPALDTLSNSHMFCSLTSFGTLPKCHLLKVSPSLTCLVKRATLVSLSPPYSELLYFS